MQNKNHYPPSPCVMARNNRVNSFYRPLLPGSNCLKRYIENPNKHIMSYTTFINIISYVHDNFLIAKLVYEHFYRLLTQSLT